MPGTFQITSNSVGTTLDTNCILITLTYNTAPVNYEPPQMDASTNLPSKGVFCLTDADHPIFCLDTFTNGSFPPAKGAPPAGRAIAIGSGLVVGKLVVRSCPPGAIWTAVTEAAQPGTVFPDWTKGASVFDEALAAAAQRAADEAIMWAERVRTARPPPTSIELMRAAGVEVEPPSPPPSPPPELLKAFRIAEETVAAEKAARVQASGPTIVGRSQAEIETELEIAVRTRQETDRASVAHSDARLAAGQKIAAQRAADQAKATRLLEKAGLA
jgi:hypothetical protein